MIIFLSFLVGHLLFAESRHVVNVLHITKVKLAEVVQLLDAHASVPLLGEFVGSVLHELVLLNGILAVLFVLNLSQDMYKAFK